MLLYFRNPVEAAIKPVSLFDHRALGNQLRLQQKGQWDLHADIPWAAGIDMAKPFLPMDADAIAFPGADAAQRLVLSQFAGLLLNATVAEMEAVAYRIRDIAWRDVLRSYPVNPEMEALGEQFFAEEAKHSLLFLKFNDTFCQQNGIDPRDLDLIIPKAYGATFQRAILANARSGGHAFWWMVAVVEEVSLLLYQQIYRSRQGLDPLFYKVHRKHFEEESRHTNYAFLMLDLIKRRNQTIKQRLHRHLDLAYSELFSTAWVLCELHKFFSVTTIAHRHPFFAKLAACVPLCKQMSTIQLVQRLFVSAPYISLILNPKHHKLSRRWAKDHRAVSGIYPTPNPAETSCEFGEEALLSGVTTNPEIIWKVS